MITNPAVKEKMLMSTAGKKSSHNIRLVKKKTGGFTLIELIVVIFLMGLIFSITMPVVRDTLLHDTLKTTSRKLAAQITWLRNESVSEYKDHILLFDIDNGKYWYEREDMSETRLQDMKGQAHTLPDDVRIIDIDHYGSEKKVEGETGIKFSRKGYIGYSLVHLGDDGDRKYTIVLEPFLAKVKIMEDYQDFEDLLQEDN